MRVPRGDARAQPAMPGGGHEEAERTA